MPMARSLSMCVMHMCTCCFWIWEPRQKGHMIDGVAKQIPLAHLPICSARTNTCTAASPPCPCHTLATTFTNREDFADAELGLREPKPSPHRVHVRRLTHDANVAQNARARVQIHRSEGPLPAKLAPALPPPAKSLAPRAPHLAVRRKCESLDEATRSKIQGVRRNNLAPAAPFGDPNPILPGGLGVSVPEAHAGTLAKPPKPGAAKPKPSESQPSGTPHHDNVNSILHMQPIDVLNSSELSLAIDCPHRPADNEVMGYFGPQRLCTKSDEVDINQWN